MHDSFGCLEVFVDSTWMWFGRVETLLRSDSDLLGSLFGVDNYAGFRPLFPSRGVPEDLSLDFRTHLDRAQEDGLPWISASWVSLSELRTIVWEEEAETYDRRIHRFIVREDGSEEWEGKSLNYPDVTVPDDVNSAYELRHGEAVYRSVRLRRSDLLVGSDFLVFMEVCEVLGKHYGAENVRWSVVFC